MKKEDLENLHTSVLLDELVDSIEIFDNKKNIIVDCTLGLAWHAREVIRKMNFWDLFIWFDADDRNLVLAKQRLEWFRDDVEKIFIHSNFVNLKQELEKRWIEKITWIYYDLWISSLHVDQKERWFSFKSDWPLDMRFDTSSWKKAADIINTYKEEDLRDIFYEYWEELSSAKIAKEIVLKRKLKKFETTRDLAELIDRVTKNPKAKTKIFQALRIEVNNELKNIKSSLIDSISLLEKDSSIFVISFHSLEDRIVKNIFRDETRDCICNDIICSCKHKRSLKLITKKPILPWKAELENNSRSRSAKARYAKKI